jgi:hypothetical protein
MASLAATGVTCGGGSQRTGPTRIAGSTQIGVESGGTAGERGGGEVALGAAFLTRAWS